MRLINADKLKEDILKKLGVKDETFLMISEKVIYDLIDEAKTVETDSKWIPVSKRMPDDFDSVLISHNQGITKAWWNGRVWSNVATKRFKTVKAWMPLPEKYKGGADDISMP